MTLLKNCLLTDDNINKMQKKLTKHKNISVLLGTELNQSQNIKFGKVFEQFIKNVVNVVKGEVIDIHFIDMPNGKVKDVDILFELNDVVYYFEVKCNLNLDSEKSKVTDQKIIKITNQLSKKYDNIVSGCLTCWFDGVGVINKLETKVYFMRDFLKIVGLTVSEEEYYNIFKELGKIIEIKTDN